MQPTLSLSLPRAAIACALLCLSAAASAANVEVHVTGVTPGKGKINVAVCDQERFLKQCAYSASAPATAAETVVTVPNVPAGTWAVLAYQDANENNQLDRNFIGIPSENYGFSRDARGKFGPPSFGDAAMAVREEGAVATVKLH
ncbi:DUF2141 domain-containing protein [Massilia forsythiae]|uniref:DUF2141 domain-containing protein n=1 Tax=Massilia forsythiae TaxID=2728020 RepID=A0A7Z2VTU3_9BURK|nr:DUF2141 domain-containing protein [Massilia forsythiae]QJD99362.1 DUF2141 domain-containing protein [Massilia forsythiae]